MMLFAGISDAFFLLLESHGFNRGRMSINSCPHKAQYKKIIGLFRVEDAGIIECSGDNNKSEAALAKVETF